MVALNLMDFKFVLLVFLALQSLPLFQAQSDPVLIRPILTPSTTPKKLVEGQIVSTESELCVSFPGRPDLCADVWEPVCDMDENLTYANCCEAKRENISDVMVGSCCGGCEVFGASSEEMMGPASEILELRSRKLLQRNSKNSTDSSEDEGEALKDFLSFAGVVEDTGEDVPIGVVFEGLVGMDNRVQIEETSTYPFSAIGRLESGCTGFLVGPRHVLTSAHCLYSLGEWLETQKFTPGQNNVTRPFKEVDWYAIQVASEWYANQSAVEYDYGMVFLTEDVGNLTGFWEFGSACNRSNLPLNLIGYPTDLNPQGAQYLASCGNVEYNCTKRTFLHSCDTFAGMSGGPMFLYQLNDKSEPLFKVRGIHFGSSSQEALNLGLTITPEMEEDIKRWIAEDVKPSILGD
eukprot:TRINITY_DN1796_c0_g1_i5.p1 TRINITY_DN1796_c0_g1~~TRINITY_DN1796_c0_g1_i5.p1  ORF type:complete len:457 (-),score=62.75 TRINITY_DN1796_c0_g1_i5:548-1762(-)